MSCWWKYGPFEPADNGTFRRTATLENEYRPPPSFRSQEWGGRKMSKDRNTACCAKLERRHFQDLVSSTVLLEEEYVQVGISHTKTVQSVITTLGARKMMYVSRLCAFSPRNVTTVYSVSGSFCFGFGDDPMASYTKFNRLEMMGTTYECPAIHFPSGIVDKGDSIVIAYGVNDCFSNMVEIDKRSIALHLFSSLPKDG
jgi:hypothetical protein